MVANSGYSARTNWWTRRFWKLFNPLSWKVGDEYPIGAIFRKDSFLGCNGLFNFQSRFYHGCRLTSVDFFHASISERTLWTNCRDSVSSFLISISTTLILLCRADAKFLAADSSSLEKYGTPWTKGASIRNPWFRRNSTASRYQLKVSTHWSHWPNTSTLKGKYAVNVQSSIGHGADKDVERP